MYNGWVVLVGLFMFSPFVGANKVRGSRVVVLEGEVKNFDLKWKLECHILLSFPWASEFLCRWRRDIVCRPEITEDG